MELELGAARSGEGDAIVEATTESFEHDVLEASKNLPVVVDFWAPWCGPCKQLTPLLEQAARAAGGKVRLVKVNIDDNQLLARQAGIQSIPAVMIFYQGQQIGGFVGADKGESEIRALFDQLTQIAGGADAGADDAFAQAEALLAEGDAAGAAQIFARLAQDNPGDPRALAGLTNCYIAAGQLDRARETLALAPPEAADDARLAQARAALELAEQSGEAGDVEAARAALAAAPDNPQARFALAEALLGAGDKAGAVDALLDIIAADRDWNDGAARQKLLTLFDAFGPNDPQTLRGRRRLSSILFS